jgi:hypothetical protein
MSEPKQVRDLADTLSAFDVMADAAKPHEPGDMVEREIPLQDRLKCIFDDAGGSDTLVDLLAEFGFESSRELADVIVGAMAEQAALAASGADRMREALENAIAEIEGGRLYETMCCSGHMCGCRGSSNADFLVYNLRQALGEPQ